MTVLSWNRHKLASKPVLPASQYQIKFLSIRQETESLHKEKRKIEILRHAGGTSMSINGMESRNSGKHVPVISMFEVWWL